MNLAVCSGVAGPPCARLREDRRGLGLGAFGVGNVLHAVIREAGAKRVEEIVAALERLEQGGEILDVHVGARRELVAPRVKDGGIVDQQRLVRPEGRVDARVTRLLFAIAT